MPTGNGFSFTVRLKYALREHLASPEIVFV